MMVYKFFQECKDNKTTGKDIFHQAKCLYLSPNHGHKIICTKLFTFEYEMH